MTVLSTGNIACVSFWGGIFRPRLANSQRILAEHVGVQFQRTVCGGSQGRAGEIVCGGTKSAGGDDDVCAVDRMGERILASCQIVRHGGVIQYLDTQLLQLPTEPGAVRIDSLATGDFVTDGDDFRIQWTFLSDSRILLSKGCV